MSIGLRYDTYQPHFRASERKQSPVKQDEPKALDLSDLDKIPGVDTVNTTITDMANEGKVKTRKALNVLMTVGLAVAAYCTGKRITKSVMDSLCNHTTYLDSTADFIKSSFEVMGKPFKAINVEKGGNILKPIKTALYNVPSKVKNYARRGVYKDVELERYAKKIKAKSVDALNAEDLKRFEEGFCNIIAKNGLSKFISGTVGLLIGAETFIEVGADKNKNCIPDLFEQKSYKEIIEIAQPKFDERVIEQMRKINDEDDEKELD